MVTGCKEHIALSRRAAGEGMVLLKNENNILPFKKGTKVALFGLGSVDYTKGGGGSGDVYCSYVRNVYDGFLHAEAEGRVQMFLPLGVFYREYLQHEKPLHKKRIEAMADEIMARYEDKVEAEKLANKETLFPDHDVTGLFASHGITWTDQELLRGQDIVRANVSTYMMQPEIPEALFTAAAEFADVAVLTIRRYSSENCDRLPEAGDYYLSEDEQALLTRIKGAFSQVVVVLNVCGVMDCSWFAEDPQIGGALIAWQAGMEGGQAIADILCGTVNPSGKLADTIARDYLDYPCAETFEEDPYYVNYYEDIFVGYRYFETMAGVQDKVLYPFGFGLSYTTFSLSNAAVKEQEGSIAVQVTVTNTGSVSGKEVVQLYCAAPQGLLGKPKRSLAAFAKTTLLKPGESQTLELQVRLEDLASYDDLGKVQASCYVLERGDYIFHLGTSVRDTREVYVCRVEDTVITQRLQPRCVPTGLPRRLLANGRFEVLPMGEPCQNYETPAPVAELSDITDEELCVFLGGSPAIGLCNTCCFPPMEKRNFPPMPTADGPAGVRLEEKYGITTTAWPCATLLACTWDTALVEKIGRCGGLEMKENDLAVWLTPALNIHRTPLCGRNFEYFSEDPLLTGKIAAAKVRGMQSVGVACSVKHFACNNRELNRAKNDSRVSERALREIYLKGFEICVKEADPWTIMSSYNLLNGTQASENYDLLTGILRKEWGFKGMVTTDWGMKFDPVREVMAGNDMKMPTGYPGDLFRALQEGKLTRAHLEICAKRILDVYENLTT